MTEPRAEQAVILNPTHRWGERPIYERDEPGSNRYRTRKIPCCLNCLVDGYEDNPEAFAECRRQIPPAGSEG